MFSIILDRFQTFTSVHKNKILENSPNFGLDVISFHWKNYFQNKKQ